MHVEIVTVHEAAFCKCLKLLMGNQTCTNSKCNRLEFMAGTYPDTTTVSQAQTEPHLYTVIKTKVLCQKDQESQLESTAKKIGGFCYDGLNIVLIDPMVVLATSSESDELEISEGGVYSVGVSKRISEFGPVFGLKIKKIPFELVTISVTEESCSSTSVE